MQLKRLPQFIEARKQNWDLLRNGLEDQEKFFEFALPHMPRLGVPEVVSAGIQQVAARTAVGLASK